MRTIHVLFICATVLLIASTHFNSFPLGFIGGIMLTCAGFQYQYENSNDRADAIRRRQDTGYYEGE